MIIAELHGKLSEHSSSVDSSEDVLTSNVFQCLKYLKPSDGLVPFLNDVFYDNAINEQLDLSLVLCQHDNVGYSLFNLILASSVVNLQFTLA